MIKYLAIIVVSALIDVVANLLLKKSNGFSHKIYGISAIALVIVAFYLLSFSLAYIPLSVAYSTWGAVGILGTIAGGWILYNEKLNLLGMLGVCMVIFAVFLLHY